MKTPKPIDCEKALSKIFELIDHELKGNEREAMEHHLHTCKSCFSRVEFEKRLKGKLKSLRDTETSIPARERMEKLINSL
jgi:anti-sigma factor (TIGR02949 family)